MKNYKVKASRATIEKTIQALAANGIEAVYAANGEEAKAKALSFLPRGAEVFAMTSITLDTIGLSKEINESGNYDSVKTRLFKMDPKTQGREMRKLGAAPDFVVGSAHAVTETGSVVVASLTGSQLPAYVYGGGTLVWVVGAQKIVKDLEEAFKRINEHAVPLESERARKAYGLPDSFESSPAKILVFNKEIQPGRVKMVIADEVLGF